MNKIKETINYFFIGLKTLLTNYLFQTVIFSISFILIVIVVYRAINLRKDVDKYENFASEIEEKMETTIKIDYPKDNNNIKNKGASQIVSCLKEPLTEDTLTENLLNISKELENTMNESNYNFAFKYKDIYTGFTLSYNSSQPIFAASVIKAPEAIYIYEEAEKGNINLNDTITYTSNYYSDGTGILKNTKFNVDYTIKELVSFSIIHSDNAAHNMLNNKYKSESMYEYWKNLGTTTIFKEKSNWGAMNADDGIIFMEELYNYYTNQNKYSEELLDYFKKSWKIITTPNNNITIASKSGWSGYSLHDTALILDQNPYILTILTNRGYSEYESFFNKMSTLIYNFHTEYWKEKISTCTKN